MALEKLSSNKAFEGELIKYKFKVMFSHTAAKASLK